MNFFRNFRFPRLSVVLYDLRGFKIIDAMQGIKISRIRAAIGYLFFVGFLFASESLSLVRGIVSKFHFNVP